ncbi:2773_t:CDS:2, partial [Acaulospora colombiana]
DLALKAACDEVFEESGKRFRPWAAHGRSCRVGEIILIVDSDTIVPEDCLRDAAREMAESPEVGVIQHESDVMQVAHNYFENGIAHFTRRINHAISFACANGEVAAFVGHNAFLRWSALQDVAFIDPIDGERKIWSESNVSEDFDMALRLQLGGKSMPLVALNSSSTHSSSGSPRVLSPASSTSLSGPMLRYITSSV